MLFGSAIVLIPTSRSGDRFGDLRQRQVRVPQRDADRPADDRDRDREQRDADRRAATTTGWPAPRSRRDGRRGRPRRAAR